MSDIDPYELTRDEASDSRDSAPVELAKLPRKIGRYSVERTLGAGGFGVVYLAIDEQLNRRVAVKVPHAKSLSKAGDAEEYLTEARIVANLDHPGIVPVHDVGSTEEFPFFIISKFVEGSDLSRRLKCYRFDCRETVDLIGKVASALHYAHRNGVVHRDVKPGNILIGNDGRPYVVDFGLALREGNSGVGHRYAGTPAYMSPEQVRGEGHRVDGRSDIFSLGVVLYEMLVNQRPFVAESKSALWEQIANHDPRPIRQYREDFPKELERICQKAISKRASERYSTAMDLAEDLEYLAGDLESRDSDRSETPRGRSGSLREWQSETLDTPDGNSSQTVGGRLSSSGLQNKVVPKGLRSFDAHDADFFLGLLPGPRDREGLPEIIRFWKHRIEAIESEDTFSVGVIYGPSGCGKSSLVKAGLLPLLKDSVNPIFVEATPDQTESRLANLLQKNYSALGKGMSLSEMLGVLRRDKEVSAGKKTLVILDQFEQWMHGRNSANGQLIQALRQCDGGNLQCIVMVRDDFWMAATRFMRALEIQLVEHVNSAAVDLFPIKHAEKVLAAFGQAFEVLPKSPDDFTADQRLFIEQSVRGLSDGDQVICVHLAVFAEMMKSKSWSPAVLKKIGGTSGVGYTFLEESFCSAKASPEHRHHQEAARAVLECLISSSGTSIKGMMQSEERLLEASGYRGRPEEFEALIRILDSELRLITPSDPEGSVAGKDLDSATEPKIRHYQLSHDYLVHPLREWLVSKQKESRRGRAQLLLEDRANAWTSRPESRQLPFFFDWLKIRWYTSRKDWTPNQRTMMANADRARLRNSVLLGLAVILSMLVGNSVRRRYDTKNRETHAEGLLERLLDAETAQVPAIIQEMNDYRELVDPMLIDESGNRMLTERQRLHVSLARLPGDLLQLETLFDLLLISKPNQLPVIRDALAPYRAELVEKLWEIAEDNGESDPRRIRAAAVLAVYAPESQRWESIVGEVSDLIVSENPVYSGWWIDHFRPIRGILVPPLTDIYSDTSRGETERSLATNILADYVTDNSAALVELVLEADERQFHTMFPLVAEQREAVLSGLVTALKIENSREASFEEKERLIARQSNAALAMLRLSNGRQIWPLFKHTPDPGTRSFLTNRAASWGVGYQAILDRLKKEDDLSARRALILCLGGYDENSIDDGERDALIAEFKDAYLNEVDPGMHSAVEWVLREWNQAEWLTETDQHLAEGTGIREGVLRAWQDPANREGASGWFVNPVGQVMTILPGPVEFAMGSPETEPDRRRNEVQHVKRINRVTAVSSKLVTEEQLEPYLRETMETPPDVIAKRPDYAVLGITWYGAAGFCNWLSEKEGIAEEQWCYIIDGENTRMRENYLSLEGYRLPTEAEIEYATRAGATTMRYYGDSDELLEKYAWYLPNSNDQRQPVGHLKPNDFGLFDAHGNAFCWCQDRYQPYVQRVSKTGVYDDVEGALSIPPGDSRVLRGGAYTYAARELRSAVRYHYVPTLKIYILGIRTARTIVSREQLAGIKGEDK